MPGKKQLKNFDQSFSTLGNEVERLKERGETIPEVPFPQNIPEEDDSLDFEFGVPELEPVDEEEDQPDLNTNDADLETNENVDTTIPDVDNLFVPGDIDESIFDDLPPLAEPSQETDENKTDAYSAANSQSSDSDVKNQIEDLFADSQSDDLQLKDEILSENEDQEGSLDDDFSDDDSAEFSLNSDLDASFNEGAVQNTNPVDLDQLVTAKSSDDDISDIPDIPDMNDTSDIDFGTTIDDKQDANSDNVDIPIDNFDLSDLEFKNDSEENTAAKADSFEDSLEDDFVIPGFSDEEFANTTERVPNSKIDTGLPPNTITDQQYKEFKKNLSNYPLNLRIQIENFIVKNEFKDETVMDVVNQVIKKDTARHLASKLEKILDISIPIPLNYERRTVEEYNEYKKTLEYQLKNRIIPGVIIGAIVAALGIMLFILGNKFVYKPVYAEILYHQGYTLIENDNYEQSSLVFDKAVSIKPKKRWFFKYARAYSASKQYDRSSKIYERLLRRFKYDKKAGLEYARMELEDLQNYEKADFIVRNYILDYHINDPEARLLLGDINLEWGDYSQKATEKAAHYEEARLQYASLIDEYGQTDLYLSRMLRYFIRTDNLREVLPLKEYFTEQKKINLEARDLVDLSGYLLEKLFGYLSPADEYLREYITGMRSLLETAKMADPTIPEAHYNLGVYFQYDKKLPEALISYNYALEMFDKAEKRDFDRIFKHIDTYRREGEIYIQQQEYLTAEQVLDDGISLFETEENVNQIGTCEDIGKLYSDLADIDYFISGDFSTALNNYNNAIKNKYDNSSNRYKIGYIQYLNKNYQEALGSFIKTSNVESNNKSLLMAMGNVLAIRNDNYASSGYYEQLLSILDNEMAQETVLFPQVEADQGDLVDAYMKVSNNLGVVQNRLAERTGNSNLRAQAMIQFSESARAWDALTRNQQTMVRLDGSNLALQNSKYMNMSSSNYEPAIYTDIPSVLAGETPLKQSSVE